MSNELIRLAYVSTLLPHVTDADIAELIVKAAKHNRDHGITGVLAIEGERVCQILEGSREAIDTLYASVSRRSSTKRLKNPLSRTGGWYGAKCQTWSFMR